VRQTLFYIPNEIAGYDLFGFGLLLAVWTVFSVVLVAWLVRRQGFNDDTKSYLPLLVLVGVVIAFVMPALAQDAEGLPIRGFGVMLLSAVALGGWMAVHRARQMGLDPEIIFSLAFWLFLFGIIGARTFYIVQKWDEFHDPRDTLLETVASVLNVTQGGLVVYGSVLGATIALFVFARRNQLSAMALGDLVAPSLMLGLAIGRVGCFMNGCCYGGACSLPWAVTFPWGSPPHARQVQTGEINLGEILAGRHPLSADPRQLETRVVDWHGIMLPNDPQARPILEAVFADSPAQRQGLEPGQTIATINGLPIRTAGQARMALVFPHFRLRKADQPAGLGPLLSTDKVVLTTAENPDRELAWTLRASPARSRPVHPTQLYSTIDALILCGLLWFYYPFRRRDGEVLALMITVYPITRYLIEVIRTDELPVFLGMTISQNISLLLLLLAAGLWFYLLRQPRGTAYPQGGAAVQAA
jgi:phosphatidylglycerol:prolipoprotein diacylglycerol transferase